MSELKNIVINLGANPGHTSKRSQQTFPREKLSLWFSR